MSFVLFTAERQTFCCGSTSTLAMLLDVSFQAFLFWRVMTVDSVLNVGLPTQRFEVCRRSLGPSRARCCGQMVNARQSLWVCQDVSGLNGTPAAVLSDSDSNSNSEVCERSSKSSVVGTPSLAIPVNVSGVDLVLEGIRAAATLTSPSGDE